MRKFARIVMGCGVALGLALSATTGAFAESWTVTLTKKQAKALDEMTAPRKHAAFAISPDGPWGRSWGKRSAAAAQESALAYCRAHLSRKKRDCLVYIVDGKRVAPASVKTRVVTQVYKPLNGRQAASILGRSNFNFSGNLAAARAQLEGGMARPEALPQDASLRAALVGRTLMNTSSKGWALWLGKDRAEFLSQTKSSTLATRYQSWRVTSDGLLCLRGGVWRSNGKPAGTRCILLGPAKGGALNIYWSSTPSTGRKAQLIAGDARGGAVRY